ncbi:Tryptophan--tRNA ligase, mitochondrial [Nowakowskiella sp. JEL0407]|nr:Tryptophan--tRNA ligase, mitochondrial [Nowakowskiella sp. JEL0407]
MSNLKFRPRTFSGIQPTGIPHLGNYLGALSQWQKFQHPTHKSLFSIVDLHAITVPQKPGSLPSKVIEMTAAVLSCGIDPNQSIIFRQSDVKQHSELSWILTCRTPVSWVTRMHQWKSKMMQKSGESVTSATLRMADDDQTSSLGLGLLSYPVLQAADILLYRSTNVPVGEDQLQHINLTCDIAQSFNSYYGKNVFCIPQVSLTETPRLMSLRNPTSKMSKSDPTPTSRIDLTDSASQIKSKIQKSVTDSIPKIYYDPVERPGISNLLKILDGCTRVLNERNRGSENEGRNEEAAEDDLKEEDEKRLEKLGEKYSSLSTAVFKGLVGDAVNETLRPCREEFERLMKDKKYIEDVLKDGAEQASEIAERTMQDVRKVVGLR